VGRIAAITIYLLYGKVFFDYFGRHFYIFSGHRRSQWLALTEPLGFGETPIENRCMSIDTRR